MAKRDEEGRLISDPDAEPWDSATDDPMGEVPMPKEKLPPKKDPKQSKLKLTSEERAFQTGWSVVKGRTCPRCNQMDREWFSGKNREAAVARGEIPGASESWDDDQKGRYHCKRCGFEACDCGAEDCRECASGGA